ncbi:MAG: hypothetical protein RR576_07935 [Oscillospiraceae bacterium]
MTTTANIKTVSNKPSRASNLELFRILLMLMIIAHHYVVNSGLTELYNFQNITPNMIFLQLFGWGGEDRHQLFFADYRIFHVQAGIQQEKVVEVVFGD